MEHIYAVLKKKGETSHDVINQLRKITSIQRIGHAGTLDPLASGVLVVGITREGTKQLGKFVCNDKEYEVRVVLGKTSTTDDAEGEKTVWQIKAKPTRTQIQSLCAELTGLIPLIPPIYSAIKIHGKAAYMYARKGQSMTLTPRLSRIYAIKIQEYRWPALRLRVKTGSGVYIRSLVKKIGEELGTGAYVGKLTRTRVGEFAQSDAYSMAQFASYWRRIAGTNT